MSALNLTNALASLDTDEVVIHIRLPENAKGEVSGEYKDSTSVIRGMMLAMDRQYIHDLQHDAVLNSIWCIAGKLAEDSRLRTGK